MVGDITSADISAAAGLGAPMLAELLASAQGGFVIVTAARHYVYANPAAAQMLGYSSAQLGDPSFLERLPPHDPAVTLAHFAVQAGHDPSTFTATMYGSDGIEREVVSSNFSIEMDGQEYGVATFWDLTDTRSDARTAIALAQTAAALVGPGSTSDILTGIARHAVVATRALACGITVVGEDHTLASAGAYGPDGPGYGQANPAWIALADTPVEAAIEAMTAGSISFAEPPGKPTVVPHARLIWEANPLTRPFAANLRDIDWTAGVYVPLAWENRLIGFLAVFLPSGLTEPSQPELGLYTALAGQAAIAVMNARLDAQASQEAALLERGRLARELHDSVSQGLFSMTMHARAAQLAMANAGWDDGGPLDRSIAELAALTRGALAEMRAIIFELRPGALAEEGLVGALRKQAAALTAREDLVVTVTGPDARLSLDPQIEEHLYRIVSEALNNVVKHARATNASVTIRPETDALRVVVADDGVGFDPQATYPGHLGMHTMSQRCEAIAAWLTVTSGAGTGAAVAVTLPNEPIGIGYSDRPRA